MRPADGAARDLFNRLLARCNDVGLLSKEIDPMSGHMLGNFPQAYSHVGIINCAFNLARAASPAEHRAVTNGTAPTDAPLTHAQSE